MLTKFGVPLLRNVGDFSVGEAIVGLIASIALLAELLLLAMFLNALLLDSRSTAPAELFDVVLLLIMLGAGVATGVSLISRLVLPGALMSANWLPLSALGVRIASVLLGVLLAVAGSDAGESALFASFYLVPSSFLLLVAALTLYARQGEVSRTS